MQMVRRMGYVMIMSAGRRAVGRKMTLSADARAVTS